MANWEHLSILKKGVGAWNQWRQEHPDVQPDLSKVNFRATCFRYIDFSYTDLRSADLSSADFDGADLNRANLSSANLNAIQLRKANLTGANIGWVNLVRSTLIEANFSNADLTYAKLGGAIVTKVKFDEAILQDADLSMSNLSGASIRGANLTRTTLRGANLTDADLTGANLAGTNLTETHLDGTNLSQTIMSGTFIAEADLSSVNGLDQVIHRSPSVIGIETIYLSKGNIPDIFLRGAGVPDSFIDYMHSLVTQPIDFYSCFISYSSQNEDIAERLYSDLQNKGVRCWFAPKDLKIGDKIRPRIDESIRLYDKLLLVLSEHSVTSQWVEQEVETALEKERKTQRAVLFPVRLDNIVMDIEGGWSALIRNTRNIGDFTRWKDYNTYQQAFERLLRDLKAEQKPKC